MRVLLAPDKFKGSATASEVVAALARGITRILPSAEIDRHPIADGGEGTVDMLLSHGFRPVTAAVRGPLGAAGETTYAVREDHAVIESAAAYGLSLLADGPTSTTSRRCGSEGVGDLIAHAVAHGSRRVTVALGGSSGTDGGAGALRALGARQVDRHGRAIAAGGQGLTSLDSLDLQPALDLLNGVGLECACDVDNVLLGPEGAAAVYAPQKGASTADVADLERGLMRWSDAVAEALGRRLDSQPGSGAAGGLAFGLTAVGARLVPGVKTMLDLTGFEDRLGHADLVVVGEGKLDRQSLHGKGPIGVARVAARSGVPVVAVVGSCDLDPMQLRVSGLTKVYVLNDLEPDPTVCMQQAGALLERVGARLIAAEILRQR